MSRDTLIEASRSAVERAYAPYSKFGVGAAVLGESGRIYTGCNVENASYGLTICAERAAISNAVCHGERSLFAVAIACSTGEVAFPCGACRQVMAEFKPSDGTIYIYLVSDRGIETYTIEELLPHAFKITE